MLLPKPESLADLFPVQLSRDQVADAPRCVEFLLHHKALALEPISGRIGHLVLETKT